MIAELDTGDKGTPYTKCLGEKPHDKIMVMPVFMETHVVVNALPQTDAPIHLLAGFTRFFPERTPAFMLQAPGRALWLAVTPRQDHIFKLASADLDARTSFTYQTARSRKTIFKRPLPRWARYAGGLVVLLPDFGLEHSGFDAVVAGDDGGEGRYEYAIGLGFAAVCYHIAGVPYNERLLVEYVERARREYVTTG
jgi:hypothetical protein